jgi:hypothetical protein
MATEGNTLHLEKKAIAEQILSREFGSHVHLDGGGVAGKEGSGRSKVLRCRVLDGPSGTPESVIVKFVLLKEGEIYDPDAAAALENPATRLLNEWASLRFLSEIATEVPPAPRFYGGDREAGLIVIEDMGRGESLVQPLLGKEAAVAEEALFAYFAALGRLNALTFGKEEEYNLIRDALGPRLARPSREAEQERLWNILSDASCAMESEAHTESERDMGQVASFVSDPGPFLTLSQTDTCPDNCMRIGPDMRLLDFEYGMYQNALSDGSRARGNFPTCWCVYRLPDSIIQRTEAVYRAELARGCPAAADDTLFYHAMTEACIYWTIENLEMFMPRILEQDERWGTSMVRQRLLVRLDTIAKATAEYGYLEAIGETARRMTAKLRAIWPPESDHMPYYPAFQGM